MGDPENDPYVVDSGLDRGLGEVGFGTPGESADPGEGTEQGADTGPLVRPGKEAAA